MEEKRVGTTVLKGKIQSTGNSPSIYVKGGDVEAVLIADGEKFVCKFNARSEGHAKLILGID